MSDKRTYLFSDAANNFISEEVTFCLDNKSDDQLLVSSDDQTFYMKFHNGYINDRAQTYVEMEIRKGSPFWENFKEKMIRLLEIE